MSIRKTIPIKERTVIHGVSGFIKKSSKTELNSDYYYYYLTAVVIGYYSTIRVCGWMSVCVCLSIRKILYLFEQTALGKSPMRIISELSISLSLFSHPSAYPRRRRFGDHNGTYVYIYIPVI